MEEAEVARAQGEHLRAIATYEKVISLDPASQEAQEAYLQMADTHFYGLRGYAAAARIYEDFVTRGTPGPKLLDARKKLASLYQFHLKDYRGAIEQYRRLVEELGGPRGKQHEEILSYLMAIGDCYFALDNFNQARIEYRALGEVGGATGPKIQEMRKRAAFQIAESLYMENRCEEALPHYEKLLSEPGQSEYDTRARFGVANCYEELGKNQEAMDLYRKILEQYPNKAVIELKIKNLQARLEKNEP
jgi:tetratricopeptide (TPR) repeat protein